MRTGPKNLITDVPGLAVGNAEDRHIRTGTTVLSAEAPFVASVAILGGAPGTRDTPLLEPDQTVDMIDAIVLSGGSAYGLDAPGGVQAALAAAGRGFAVGAVRVPLVCGAILFDLLNGGDKGWGDMPPYRHLGRLAFDAAAADFSIGRAGAGFGATLADGPGGLGSASMILESGAIVGALVAVNAVGTATMGKTPHYWAAPFEIGTEFGGLGLPPALNGTMSGLHVKGGREPGHNTTLGIVATDLALTKAQAKRLAIMAHDGITRALWPSHTPLDGDIVFTVSTGARPMNDAIADMIELGWAATATLARAIARGVFEARR